MREIHRGNAVEMKRGRRIPWQKLTDDVMCRIRQILRDLNGVTTIACKF